MLLSPHSYIRPKISFLPKSNLQSFTCWLFSGASIYNISSTLGNVTLMSQSNTNNITLTDHTPGQTYNVIVTAYTTSGRIVGKSNDTTSISMFLPSNVFFCDFESWTWKLYLIFAAMSHNLITIILENVTESKADVEWNVVPGMLSYLSKLFLLVLWWKC